MIKVGKGLSKAWVGSAAEVHEKQECRDILAKKKDCISAALKL